MVGNTWASVQISVAMGNASDEVKCAAKFTAPTNDEDGVAIAIKDVLRM